MLTKYHVLNQTLKNSSPTIGIIGNGSWGTALAKILTDNGNSLHWWFRNPRNAEEFRRRNHNPHYLSSVKFPAEAIQATDCLMDVFQASQLIILAVPSAFAENLLAQTRPEDWRGKQVVSAIKGILPESSLMVNQYLLEEKGLDPEQYVALSGPCHAEEVAQERLSYLTFSGKNPVLTQEAASLFENDYIRSTINHDVYGVQLASVLKNVYAIGAGIAHGLDYGDNFLSVLISNAYKEMYGFLAHVYARQFPDQPLADFHSSAYLGDLLVTCYSLHSRNRSFGNMLGKGYSVKNASLEKNMVAEGYYGSRGTRKIAASWAYPLPIAESIYEILWEGQAPETIFQSVESLLS